MAAPPTPPPMTTARASVLTRTPLSTLPPCGGRGLVQLRSGRGLGRLNRRGLGGVALGQHVVDDAHEQDRPKSELEHRDRADRAADRHVRQSAERRVLSADRGVARPQEVDLHGDSPHKGEDVDDRSPLAELEGSRFFGPALQPGKKDGDVAEDVGEVDHPGRTDGNGARARVIDERETGEDADHDARADWGVQRRVHFVEVLPERELAVARHAIRKADGRGLDGEAANVDRREDNEEVQVRGPTREVGFDDGYQWEWNLAGADVGHELAHVARHRDDGREQEDRADDGGTDDGCEDGSWRFSAWVLGLLR